MADTAPDPLRAKAILSLAAVASNIKDYQSQLRYLVESAKTSGDVSTTVKAHLGIAIYKSREGFHKQSLSDLENLYTLARHSQPVVFFDYLNSLAVELGKVGRIQEARNVSRLVLASPFTFAYPEWRETAEEIRQARRSFVTIGASPSNVLAMPEREPSEQPTVQPKPAQVLSFAKGKKKMNKKNRDKQIEKSVAQMSMKEMGFKLLELITSNQADEYQMRTILIFVINLLSAPVKPPNPSA